MLYKAIMLAKLAHSDQKRKWTQLPYFSHCLRVMDETVKIEGATEEMLCAAVLHDVVEDTPYTLSYIIKEFGNTVGMYVDGLTNKSKEDKTLNRAERKKVDRKRLANCCKEVKQIKIIDRIDNLLDMPIEKCIDFAKLYVEESQLLFDTALWDVDNILSPKLQKTINSVKYRILWHIDGVKQERVIV